MEANAKSANGGFNGEGIRVEDCVAKDQASTKTLEECRARVQASKKNPQAEKKEEGCREKEKVEEEECQEERRARQEDCYKSEKERWISIAEGMCCSCERHMLGLFFGTIASLKT